MKVLMIEDDLQIVDTVFLAFQIRWPEAELLYTHLGESGIDLVQSESPDIVILDLGLPDISGFDVLKRIRLFSDVPLLILSVSSEEADIVKGLNWGADDYMAKPFRQLELMARVKALARRTRFPAEEPLLAFGELRFEPSKRRLLCGEKEIRLTQSEGNIMRRLLKEPGHSVPLSSLAEAVWGSDCGGSDGLKVYIRRLREKIEADPKNPQIILTKAGVGYFLADPETAGQYPGCRVPSAN